MSVEGERESALGGTSGSVEGKRERASGGTSGSVEGKREREPQVGPLGLSREREPRVGPLGLSRERASGGTSGSLTDTECDGLAGSPGSHCAFVIDTLTLSPLFCLSSQVMSSNSSSLPAVIGSSSFSSSRSTSSIESLTHFAAGFSMLS